MAARLGFLDLANTDTRLAASEGTEAALRRCQVAQELAQRTFKELTSPERLEIGERVALL